MILESETPRASHEYRRVSVSHTFLRTVPILSWWEYPTRSVGQQHRRTLLGSSKEGPRLSRSKQNLQPIPNISQEVPLICLKLPLAEQQLSQNCEERVPNKIIVIRTVPGPSEVSQTPQKCPIPSTIVPDLSKLSQTPQKCSRYPKIVPGFSEVSQDSHRCPPGLCRLFGGLQHPKPEISQKLWFYGRLSHSLLPGGIVPSTGGPRPHRPATPPALISPPAQLSGFSSKLIWASGGPLQPTQTGDLGRAG